MHNLGTVIKFEFIRTLKKKTFWLSLLSFPAIFIAIFAVMFFSSQAAEDRSREQAEATFSAAVMDESGLINPQVIDAFGASLVADKSNAIEQVKNEEISAFMYYPKNVSQDPIEVYATEAGLSENDKYTVIAEQFLKSSVSQSIDSPEVIAVIQGNIRSTLTTYEEGQVTPGFERVILPGLFLILFYALIVLLANQMLTSTTEEKENRVIEMVLTTVSATTLIIGKIISLIMLGAVQILVILSPVIIAYSIGIDSVTANLPAINLDQLEVDWFRIGIGAVLFVLSFLLFTGILVAIGAAVPTAKEANSFFGVIIVAMLVPLYSIAVIVTDPSQLIVQVFSYFPLTAPVTLMIRNAIGNIGNIEIAIGIGVLVMFSLLSLWVAINTFKYGTLEYSRRLSIKEILKFG